MGERHNIEVEWANGHTNTYVKHCYQFKKTAMYRQLIQMLDTNKIKSFRYGKNA